jgi:uracil-DNA glycosylase
LSKIMLIGEAWGEAEEEAQAAFVGPSGYVLNGLLAQAGIARDECYLTNVFNLWPRPSNDILNLCGPKTLAIPGLPALQRGKFVRNEYAPQLARLYAEIAEVQPNVIVALGATAAWALLHTSGIKQIRGYVAPTAPAVTRACGKEFKVVPTYHPANISRDWSNRPIALADLDKAKGESGFPELRRPRREIWIEPTLDDLALFEPFLRASALLSVDIETWNDQITCIGFAPNESLAIVIPFITFSGDHNYWSAPDEVAAWSYVRRWLTLAPTVFQNGLYDMQFLWRSYRIPCPTAAEDTMLLHHAFQPEMEKGLGFLASVYVNDLQWKQMRKGKTHD